MEPWTILPGDCRDVLRALEPGVQCCVTSPPYWSLRSYLPDDHPDKAREIGTEAAPDEYVACLVDVFRAVRRVLASDGTLWLNLGDTYLKNKDLAGLPWRVAFALQADGWHLRSDVIWSKPNPMPESVTDRPTKAHEYLFLLSKGARYFYDADAVSEPSVRAGEDRGTTRGADGMTGGYDGHRTRDGLRRRVIVGERRNKRSVWTVAPQPYQGAHFAVMPSKLAEPCILAGSRMGDLVLDPFSGVGTTAVVALQHARRFVGCEINPEFVELAEGRIIRDASQGLLFTPTGDVPDVDG